MSLKTFNHNGGVWTRPDIPSPTPQPWKCHVCGKDIDSQLEEYQVEVVSRLIDKTRYIPASRYWHGYIVTVEYCSIECSFADYEREHGYTTNTQSTHSTG